MPVHNELSRLLDLAIQEDTSKNHLWKTLNNRKIFYKVFSSSCCLETEERYNVSLEDIRYLFNANYVTEDLLEALSKQDFAKAALLFNINIRLGPQVKKSLLQHSKQLKEPLSASLLRYYHRHPHKTLYFFGWCLDILYAYETAFQLNKEFKERKNPAGSPRPSL